MAGLFDFKSAEEILQERRAATKANQQQLLSTIVSVAPKESRQASMLGAQLGIALGNILGKSEKEQLQEFRDMGETTQAMEKAGVGGEGSSYGAGVLQQAQAEEQRRMGLLPEEMQRAIGEERQAEQLEQAFQNVDMNDPEQTAELVKLAIASGNTEAASLAVTFNKNALEASKDKGGLTAKDVTNLYKDYTAESIAAHLKDPSNPLVPIKKEGFTPESRLGKLAYDLERLKGLPSTPSIRAAIAAIQKEINSEQVQYDAQLREFSANIIKDFAGKGNASEVADWNKGIDLTTNLMSQYEGNPSKVRSHLNKYFRPYDGGVFGSSGFNVKEEYQKNVLTTQDGRAYYYDPDNKQFIGWVQ